MGKRIRKEIIIILAVFVLGVANVASAAIEYKETLTRIVHKRDLGGTASSRVITDFAASADGSKLALKSTVSDPDNYGLFLLNGDGSALHDIATPGSPPGVRGPGPGRTITSG
jgi:hypothetical protein